MGLVIEELLYSAMEDFQVPVLQSSNNDFMKALGAKTKEPRATITKLPPFTLVAASTQSGLVSAPLRSRFVQALQLQPYSDDDLTKIILNAAGKMDFNLSKRSASEIAKRSRSTARIAICNLSWIAEYCTGLEVSPNLKTITNAFGLKSIDEWGLTELDRKLLSVLLDANGPVGIGSLSAALNEATDTIENSIEPYLIQQGFMRRESRGRIALPKAVKMVKGRKVA
jgi:Holliday junction DNA helicase RuvB